jgi:hypothetical protein
MRKFIAVALIAGIACLYAGPAFSATDTQGVSNSVIVSDLFNIVINDGPISYGTIIPGGTSGPDEVNLCLQTNLGEQWSLSVQGYDLIDGASHSIPATAVRAYVSAGAGAGNGAATWPLGQSTELGMLGTAQQIYVSDADGSDETLSGTTGVTIHFNSFIQVPGNSVPGTYSGAIDVLATNEL